MTKTIGILGDWVINPKNKETVKVIAHIRNNETNEIRQYETELYWDEDYNGPNTYIWEDGNYGCDCNRKLFWGNVVNEDYWDDSPCGEGGFSVNLQNPKTGKFFYTEYNV